MGWDDADIARFQFNQLYLSRGPTGEGEQLLPQTDQSQWVIRCLIDGEPSRGC